MHLIFFFSIKRIILGREENKAQNFIIKKIKAVNKKVMFDLRFIRMFFVLKKNYY